jgi:hypothetical protein
MTAVPAALPVNSSALQVVLLRHPVAAEPSAARVHFGRQIVAPLPADKHTPGEEGLSGPSQKCVVVVLVAGLHPVWMQTPLL